ncbi:cyclic di-GMP phosphodiesterase Gmr [mine drainage metagenome]|uniref:Cyclic di-GMP phosphodiesterase Gmr n=1 Tax=mine drainage metagenome TaxID=410659 RepID=A0A1J5RG17_9ZZZZ
MAVSQSCTPKYVLLVEDNPLDSQLASARLERYADIRLSCVSSLAECLDFLGHYKVDAILLDANLPDGEGVELIDRVLANCGGAAVIILTGSDDEQFGLAAVNRGCQDFLVKGAIHNQIIYRTILYSIERKRGEAQSRLYEEVINNIREGICITDAQANIVSVNPAFCRITGYEPSEVIGKNPRLLASGRQDHSFYGEMWTTLRRRGAWRGEIWNRTKSGEIYPQWLSISAVGGPDPATTRYIGAFLDITSLKAHEQSLLHLAHHDSLTGLPNRLLLQDRVERAIAFARRDQSRVALLFLDLDHFKIINDSLGHAAGDALLKAVSARLCGALRHSDTVARLGGDEFMVLAANVGTAAEIAEIAEKIAEALSAPVDLAGQSVTIGSSIGVAVFPEDGEDFPTLMKHADTAMYRAKHNGRNTFCLFDPHMNAAAVNRLHLEAELRQAIARNEFELHYQPQIDLPTGKLIGVEALIRWNCRKRGLVPPSVFIPIAEESNLISQIGAWVIEEACRQLARWREAGWPGMRVAVNVSARQFSNIAFAESVARLLRHYRLDHSQMEVELTESTVMANPEKTIQQLRRLRELGIQVSVDDFGTGYSSLSYLKRLPISTIKIDRSFVHEVHAENDNAAIVAAILGLARALDMSIIAEGVETEAEENHLRGAGAVAVQGFRYARPMPPAALDAWLRQSQTADALH